MNSHIWSGIAVGLAAFIGGLVTLAIVGFITEYVTRDIAALLAIGSIALGIIVGYIDYRTEERP